MNLFRTRAVKSTQSICQCKHCGNPQADKNDKCFYCRQLQPVQPTLAIDDMIDLETLHGIKKERTMSYVDVPFRGWSKEPFRIDYARLLAE